MKMEITYKGNIFTYTLHDCRNEGNGEKGYIAFVDLFKGCTTSIQNNNMKELEKMVRSAIKDWLEPTSLNVAERQRLEQLERLVRSKDYFYKAMAENVSDDWIEKGFDDYLQTIKSIEMKDVDNWLESSDYEDYLTIASKAFKAGIKYALKSQVEGE